MDVFYIELDLGKHCIATEVKRKYNRSLSMLLKAGSVSETIEAEVELLKLALETVDFSAMRARYEELAGNTEKTVVLGQSENGLFVTIESVPAPLIFR